MRQVRRNSTKYLVPFETTLTFLLGTTESYKFFLYVRCYILLLWVRRAMNKFFFYEFEWKRNVFPKPSRTMTGDGAKMCQIFKLHMCRLHALTMYQFISPTTRFFPFADFKFSIYTPSIIASASIAASLQGLDWTTKNNCSLSELLTRIHRITGIERVSTTYLYTCTYAISSAADR